MGNENTTTRRRTQAPAKPPAKPPEEFVKDQVQGEAELPASDKPAVRRLTTIGWAWMNHANYAKGDNQDGGKKSRLYFTLKYKDPEDKNLKQVEVHVFGPQADYLYENLEHNVQVVARGRFESKERRDQPGVMEPIFIPNDAWGITLPIPKKRR